MYGNKQRGSQLQFGGWNFFVFFFLRGGVRCIFDLCFHLVLQLGEEGLWRAKGLVLSLILQQKNKMLVLFVVTESRKTHTQGKL